MRQILSPNRLRLSDGSEIQLLGIEPLEAKSEAALDYLEKMVLGNPVFLKFDSQATIGSIRLSGKQNFYQRQAHQAGPCARLTRKWNIVTSSDFVLINRS